MLEYDAFEIQHENVEAVQNFKRKKLLPGNNVVLCKASRTCVLKMLRFHIASNAFKNETCRLMYFQPKLLPFCDVCFVGVQPTVQCKEETYSIYSYLLLKKAKLFFQKHHGVSYTALEKGMLLDFLRQPSISDLYLFFLNFIYS